MDENNVCVCAQGANLKQLDWYSTLRSMLKDPEDQEQIAAMCELNNEIEFLEMQIEVNECYCGE